MSTTIKTIIMCDKCKLASASLTSPDESRLSELMGQVADAGWDVDGDVHACPKCATPKEKSTEEEKPAKKSKKKGKKNK
jgi:hypothetical protein